MPEHEENDSNKDAGAGELHVNRQRGEDRTSSDLDEVWRVEFDRRSVRYRTQHDALTGGLMPWATEVDPLDDRDLAVFDTVLKLALDHPVLRERELQ